MAVTVMTAAVTAVMVTKRQTLTSITLMGRGETEGWILKDYVSATLAEWRFKFKI